MTVERMTCIGKQKDREITGQNKHDEILSTKNESSLNKSLQ
jgi:hypothetical protein